MAGSLSAEKLQLRVSQGNNFQVGVISGAYGPFQRGELANTLNMFPAGSGNTWGHGGFGLFVAVTRDFNGDGITDLATGCTNYYTQPTSFLPGVACISSTDEADLANGNLRLFPNPVQSLLNLQVGEMKAGEVEIYCLNNLGQILLQYNVAHPGGEFAFQMPAQSLPNGWYTLAIRSAEGNWAARAPFVKAD